MRIFLSEFYYAGGVQVFGTLVSMQIIRYAISAYFKLRREGVFGYPLQCGDFSDPGIDEVGRHVCIQHVDITF